MDLSEFKVAIEPLGLSDEAQSGFLRLFTRFKQASKNALKWDAVRSPDPSHLVVRSSGRCAATPAPGSPARRCGLRARVTLQAAVIANPPMSSAA